MCLPGPALLILLVATSLATPLNKMSPVSHDNSWSPSSRDAEVDDNALQLAVDYLNSRLHPEESLNYDDLFRHSEGVDHQGGGSHLMRDEPDELDLELLSKQLEIVTALQGELLGGDVVADETRLEDVEQEDVDRSAERSRRDVTTGSPSGGNRPPCQVCRLIPRDQVHGRPQNNNDDSKELNKETFRAKRETGSEGYGGNRLDNGREEIEGILIPWDEKRAADFHSWGGKRDGNTHNAEPESGKRGPSFNSWGGKRGPSFNSWGGKRVLKSSRTESPRSIAIVGDKRAPEFNSWGGKRGPAFHSWGGKRATGFNSWGGKRAPDFSTWGGKRAPAFNSWGGKRAPAFNSWGGKRAPAFNSWGGKRAPDFSTWGGKRAPAFNSWGGKRAPAFNSWGGKRSSEAASNRTSMESIPDEMMSAQDVDGGHESEPVPIMIKVEKRASRSEQDSSQPSNTRIARNKAADFYPWGGKRSDSI